MTTIIVLHFTIHFNLNELATAIAIAAIAIVIYIYCLCLNVFGLSSEIMSVVERSLYK